MQVFIQHLVEFVESQIGWRRSWCVWKRGIPRYDKFVQDILPGFLLTGTALVTKEDVLSSHGP